MRFIICAKQVASIKTINVSLSTDIRENTNRINLEPNLTRHLLFRLDMINPDNVLIDLIIKLPFSCIISISSAKEFNNN